MGFLATGAPSLTARFVGDAGTADGVVEPFASLSDELIDAPKRDEVDALIDRGAREASDDEDEGGGRPPPTDDDGSVGGAMPLLCAAMTNCEITLVCG